MNQKEFLEKFEKLIDGTICSYEEYLDNMMTYEFPDTKL